MSVTGRLTALSAALFLITACGGGGESESTAEFGRMNLNITDSPVADAAKVVVQFTGVEIKASAEGAPEVFDFAAPRQIDLWALNGGGSEILLQDETLPAGAYEWIRLKVNAGRDASDSYIELKDGSRHALFIPSGNETGLKLVQGFLVGAGQTVDFTIDVDLHRSVIRPPGLGGPYILRPALRLINNFDVGQIEGKVAASIAADDCTPAVYLYAGSGVVPDDVGSPTAPLATTFVKLDEASGEYRYRLAFVPAGNYTVALTCDADEDEADADDAIEFIGPQNATVAAGQTTQIDFPPAT
jgi:hypothetical protein